MTDSHDLPPSTESLDGELMAIFPIGGVVFFPKTIIPLHIFESRYRRLIQDVQTGDGRFILTGFTDDTPNDVGIAVKVVEQEMMPDGRSNILAQGLHRVRIDEYFRHYTSDDYAIAQVRALPEEDLAGSLSMWQNLRTRLYKAFKFHFEQMSGRKLNIDEETVNSSFTPEEAINAVCYYLELDSQKKQTLLEENNIYKRGEKVLRILTEMNHMQYPS